MEAFGPQWLATIASGVLLCLGQALVALGQRRMNLRMDEGERKRNEAREETEAKRKAEAEWRKRIEDRMYDQDKTIKVILAAQCTQLRTDTVHRAHRYLDDLGCASIEEKEAFWAEYQEYCSLCEEYGIENNFVDKLARRVMDLPERNV